jgi:bifunctional non-homologous end joining protein LigD
MESVPRRLGQKEDPWADMIRHARSIASRREQLDDLLDQEEPAKEEE